MHFNFSMKKYLSINFGYALEFEISKWFIFLYYYELVTIDNISGI